MILSFKRQFVQPILTETKIHSIRLDRLNRWEAGKIIHFATGVRTKHYNCFKEGICVSTQIIEILPKANEIYIDGKIIPQFSAWRALATNDGFAHIGGLLDWFKSKPFRGKIIHWTELEYIGQDVYRTY